METVIYSEATEFLSWRSNLVCISVSRQAMPVGQECLVKEWPWNDHVYALCLQLDFTAKVPEPPPEDI